MQYECWSLTNSSPKLGTQAPVERVGLMKWVANNGPEARGWRSVYSLRDCYHIGRGVYKNSVELSLSDHQGFHALQNPTSHSTPMNGISLTYS